MPLSDPSRDDLEQTRDLMRRAQQALAYGGVYSVFENVLEFGNRAFPQFALRGEGCRIYDTVGQCYIDWFMGWGPMLLGYRHPEVENAVADQLAKGVNHSLMNPLEVEVAELLCALVPCAERVAFGKNGSDVTCAAVRGARAYTGRNRILCCGYHGFHDWFRALNPECQGVPGVLRSEVASFPYNDATALEEQLRACPEEFAAVIIDPVQDMPPDDGFLQRVRDLTTRYGALLIFDEIVTGFRVAPGGAQQAFGIVPDLACFGKALANGLPLSALVGKAEHMRLVPAVGFDLTFRGEALSLAAARACLRVFQREPVCAHIANAGTLVRNAFDRACLSAGVPWRLTGHPSRMYFHFKGGGGLSAEGARALFLQECLKGGVLHHAFLLPSYSLDQDAIQQTIQALIAAVDTVATALQDGNLQGRLHFEAPPHFFSGL